MLGVDPGTLKTGLGVVSADGNHFRCRLARVIRTRAGAPLHERLRTVHEGVTVALRETGARVVAIEGVFVQRDVRAALRLGHARGVALLAAAQADAEVYEYAPAKVKRAVTGRGGAQKDQVQYMVRALLRIEAAVELPEDAADALAVCICHLLQGAS